ncbi:heme-binding domain-containing protein [Sphingobacterium sp. E70]|nr:heme-binding domain-containing protein [Sphingobacterium sp. E70]ULT25795.1 heme-binding domain-containing protein [Sphingobacterium sp. E70]
MKHAKQIRLLPIVLLCTLAAFIALQFFNAPIEQRPVTGPMKNVPQEVTQILERSCYDCHSNAQHLTF